MTQVTMNVYGIKEALREINSIDKKARRKVTNDYKKIVKPVVTAAKGALPTEPPVSGWGRSWTTENGRKLLPWDGALGAKYVNAKVSGRKPRVYNGQVRDLATFVVQWAGAINAIYDMAGRRNLPDTAQGAVMIRALETRYGKASRVLWPAYEANADEVVKQVRLLIEDVMAQVNRNLVAD
jgi:hypothetical protein